MMLSNTWRTTTWQIGGRYLYSSLGTALSRKQPQRGSWAHTVVTGHTTQEVCGVCTVAAATVDATAPMPPKTDFISSTANGYVKHCAKLRTNRKYRSAAGRVLVTGQTIVQELAEGSEGFRDSILTLFVRSGANAPMGMPTSIHRIEVTEGVFKKISGLETVTGVDIIAEVEVPKVDASSLIAVETLQRVLVLDGVSDPGNMGTLLRTALALGWEAAYLLPGCCDPLNEKAMRASRGAPFKLPVAAGTWADLDSIVDAHRMVCVAADLEGDYPKQGQLKELQERDAGVALILGNEGQGISRESTARAAAVTIPILGDQMESLNVGVAGGILMFFFSRAMGQLNSEVYGR